MSQKQTIINNLQTHLQSLPEVVRVFQSRQGALSIRPAESPVVEIIDEGIGAMIVEDETGTRWLSEITLRVHASRQKSSDKAAALYDAVESIVASLVRDPALGAMSLVIIDGNEIERGETIYLYDLTIQMQHHESKDNSALAVGAQTGVFYTARTKMLTELEALKTSMSGDAIKFSHVYTQHATSNLLLNAVSFQLIDSNPEERIKESSRDVIVFRTSFEVRVHTGYSGRGTRSDWSLILLDKIHNHFATNRDLGSSSDNIRFAGSTGAEASVEFDDSATTGAKIELDIRSAVEYTQA